MSDSLRGIPASVESLGAVVAPWGGCVGWDAAMRKISLPLLGALLPVAFLGSIRLVCNHMGTCIGRCPMSEVQWQVAGSDRFVGLSGHMLGLCRSLAPCESIGAGFLLSRPKVARSQLESGVPLPEWETPLAMVEIQSCRTLWGEELQTIVFFWKAIQSQDGGHLARFPNP